MESPLLTHDADWLPRTDADISLLPLPRVEGHPESGPPNRGDQASGSEPTASQDAEQTARRFCGEVVGCFLIGCLAVATLNFVVNPYDQYPVHWFQPLVQTSRTEKVQLLMARQQPPEGLILGSSRVLKIEPDYLQQMTGLQFFNAGVNYGKVEDCLALLRWFEHQFGRTPRCVVIGLDVAGFSNRAPVDARLLNEPTLGPWTPALGGLSDRFQRWRELLSWQQTTNSLRSVVRSVRPEPVADPAESYRDDGLLIYHERERQIVEGTYDFAAALEYNKREYTQLLNFTALSPERLALWNELLDYCKQHQIELRVFLTPQHPLLERHLLEHTRYSQFHEQLVQTMERLAQEHKFVFRDLAKIDAFGGDAASFVDGVHPREPNTRRMMDQLWHRTW